MEILYHYICLQSLFPVLTKLTSTLDVLQCSVYCLNDLLKLNNTNINKKYPVYLHFTLTECPHGLESFRWRKLVKIEVRDF